MKKVTIDVFEFSELSKKSQERVINDTIEFMLELGNDSEFVKDAITQAELQRVPWFTGAILWEKNRDYIMNAYINTGLYYQDGRYYSHIGDIELDDTSEFWNSLQQDEKLAILESALWAMDNHGESLTSHLDNDPYELAGKLESFLNAEHI